MDLSSKRQRLSLEEREIHIPTELVTDILTRLPVKTLMRFKCVSKLWSSLIRSQYFSNRFLTVSPRQRLYMCFWDSDEDDRKSVILSLVPHATNPSSFVVDHEVTIPWLGSYHLQNLCGFMWSSDSKIPRIYNPATRQLVTLPARNSCHGTIFYFGHDPVKDRYKAICSELIRATTTISRSPEGIQKLAKMCIIRGRRPMETITRVSITINQRVLVLKPRASWKQVSPTSYHIPVSRPGLSINGRIYYLAMTSSYSYLVVSFNIKSEKFKMIRAPRKDREFKKAMSLIEYGGEVTVFDHTHLTARGKVNLWVLKDAGKNKWSKKTLVLEPSQLHLVHNIRFELKGTTQSGNKVLLMPRDLPSPFYILCYDLKNNDMTKIDINGIPDHWFDKKAAKRCSSMMYMDQGESISYLGDLI